METQIDELDGHAIEADLAALSRILIDSVADGAAVGFMAPVSVHEAARFWLETVRPDVEAGRRTVFGARRGGDLVGTVQLLTAMPVNQPHRCEIAKMIVHPHARRMGIGRALMTRALDRARELGKTLVTLDTRTGDVAEALYASLGFEIAGSIPDYAFDPNGRARHATTYMYRGLKGRPSA